MSTGNYKGLVEIIKDRLNSAGQLWQTNCDAFEITGRVAWELRNEGALLVPKLPGQNGCTLTKGPHQGRTVSHDAIQFPDGWADILIGAGPSQNLNTPTWQWHAEPVGAGLAPWDMDAGGPVPIPPQPPADELLKVLAEINAELKIIRQNQAGMLVMLQGVEADLDLLAADMDKVEATLEKLREVQLLGVAGPMSFTRLHLKPPVQT